MEKKPITVFTVLILLLATIIGAAVIKDSTTKTSTKTHLQGLNIQNWAENDHNITVVVERNETVVYWKNLYLEGSFKNESGVSTFNDKSIPKENLGGQIEDYVVFVRVKETGERTRYEFASQTIDEIKESCNQKEYLEISITVRETGSIRESVTCET